MNTKPREQGVDVAEEIVQWINPLFALQKDKDALAALVETRAIRPVADPLEKVLERWDKMSLVIDSAMAREAILDPRAQHHAEIVSVLIHDTRAALAAYRGEGK